MRELHDAALAYARRGWRVFPLHGIVGGRCTCGRTCSSPGKHPLVRRGLYEAATDARSIKEWWRRWRSANIAVATGSASGIVVIDIDVPEGERSLELLNRLGRPLPPTLAARTGSGGRHLYYRAPEHELGNAVGGLPGIDEDLPGIDLRAEGGYVLAPPSLHISGYHYEWLSPCGNLAGTLQQPGANLAGTLQQPGANLAGTLQQPGANLAAAPGWLRPAERVPVPVAQAPATFSGDGSAYGLAVLTAELDRLSVAPKGRRNHTLNRAAFAIARLVAGGELLEAPARAALLARARAVGLTEHESNLTIESAFRAGSARPRSAPHRLRL